MRGRKIHKTYKWDRFNNFWNDKINIRKASMWMEHVKSQYHHWEILNYVLDTHSRELAHK